MVVTNEQLQYLSVWQVKGKINEKKCIGIRHYCSAKTNMYSSLKCARRVVLRLTISLLYAQRQAIYTYWLLHNIFVVQHFFVLKCNACIFVCDCLSLSQYIPQINLLFWANLIFFVVISMQQRKLICMILNHYLLCF